MKFFAAVEAGAEEEVAEEAGAEDPILLYLTGIGSQKS